MQNLCEASKAALEPPAARHLCHHRNAKQPQPCHSGSLGLHCSWELSRAETFILMPISPCILPYPFLTHLHHLSHRPHVCFFYTIHPHPSSNQPTVHYHRRPVHGARQYRDLDGYRSHIEGKGVKGDLECSNICHCRGCTR